MTIHVKEKELAAVGISVATGCKPCTDYHVRAVRKAGAAEDEIRQAVAVGLAVRESATAIMARHARAHLGPVEPETKTEAAEQVDRTKVLVSIGAAFGVNCPASLEKYLAQAKAVGISENEITTIVKLAAFIRKRAASHVEQLVNMTEEATA